MKKLRKNLSLFLFLIMLFTGAKSYSKESILQININQNGHYNRYVIQNVKSKNMQVWSAAKQKEILLTDSNSSYLRKLLKKLYKQTIHNPKFCGTNHLVVQLNRKRKQFACLSSRTKLGVLARELKGSLQFIDMLDSHILPTRVPSSKAGTRPKKQPTHRK